MKQTKGIALAGNILTDVVKRVDCYPEVGMLANITQVSRAVGGCVPNTGIDLKKIDPALPVRAMGKIGNDEAGAYVRGELERYGIDCRGLSVSATQPTSFSDVMSQPSGERTFFHARGANAEFSPEDLDLESLECEIFHIGYILLLDRFDRADPEYGTAMARLLSRVQERGIRTSIDVVSDSSADYKAKILPALRYTDIAVINEIESSMLSDLPPYTPEGKLWVENIEKTMRFMVAQGVREKVVVHCKRAGFALDVKTGAFTLTPSLNLPRSEILGSVGAGDAFCAGTLYALLQGYDDPKMLQFAAAAAASNLFSENSVDGMRSREEIEKMIAHYGWETLEI